MSKKISQLTIIPTLSFNSSEYFPVNQSGDTYKIPLSSVISSIEYPTTDSRVVKTFSELQAANSNSSVTKIILGADITISSSIIIGATKTIFFQKYKFIKSGSSTIQFLGNCEAGRYQIFSGFQGGDIVGVFKNHEIYPEWWGLTDNNHDVAINCAISATPSYTQGHTISLASGTYNVSAPIDLRGSLCRLKGAGSGATTIYATSSWISPTWYSSQYYASGGPMLGNFRPNYISGLVLMGGKVSGGGSFRTGVQGMAINCYYAVSANPTKKVSGIHATAYIEENSIIEDVLISYFSGFGVGIDAESGTNTLNGLNLRNFWITGSMDRDSVPIMTGAHSGVISIRDGTIDCRIDRENTIYATGAYPARPITWPVYGILATGNQTIIEGVHLEGMLIGILVWDPGFACSVKISNISTTAMMESALPSGEMRWYNDYERLSASGQIEPAPSLAYQLTAFGDPTLHQYINKYGATIVISKLPEKMEYNSAYAYNVTATISNVRNSSSFTPRYVLRDAIYGIHASAFGKGQYPNVTGTSSLGFYTRGQAWVHQTNSNDLSAYPYRSGTAGTTSVKNTAYSVSAPDTSRTYFLGPIY